MSDDVKVVERGGIGFTGILQIVFIVLKLCGVINWSWWLVLLPLIIGGGLFVGLLITLIVVLIISERT